MEEHDNAYCDSGIHIDKTLLYLWEEESYAQAKKAQ